MEGQQSTKSWFKRPEGKAGGIALIGLIAGGLIALKMALPFLITLAANTLYLMLMLGGIGLLAALVINPGSRNTGILAYKMFFKMLTGMLIQLDPIMILNDYVNQLYKNLQEMADQIGEVKGVLRKLKMQIDKYTEECNQQMTIARIAKEKGDKKNASVNHRKAMRRQESIQKLTKLYQKIEMIARVLRKMHENCAIVAEDTADDIDMKKSEWEAVKKASGAMRSAMSIINGDGDKRATFEQAMEVVIDDISNKMGEMENFMDMSATLMDSIDLENASFDDGMMANLEKWENNADSFILGDSKSGIMQEVYDNEKDATKEDFSTKELRQRTINIFNS